MRTAHSKWGQVAAVVGVLALAGAMGCARETSPDPAVQAAQRAEAAASRVEAAAQGAEAAANRAEQAAQRAEMAAQKAEAVFSKTVRK